MSSNNYYFWIIQSFAITVKKLFNLFDHDKSLVLVNLIKPFLFANVSKTVVTCQSTTILTSTYVLTVWIRQIIIKLSIFKMLIF